MYRELDHPSERRVIVSTMEAACDLREVASRVVRALSACDEASLVARARHAQREPGLARSPANNRIALAMPAALLRPLRLLKVTGVGPTYVAELPFPHVDAAVTAAADFGARTVPMHVWLDAHGLGDWIIDPRPWKRRVAAARDNARVCGGFEAFRVCQGLAIVASRQRQIRAGRLDGADAIELILEDGSAAMLATAGNQPTPLLGGWLVAAHGKRWIFDTPRCGRLAVTLAHPDSVLRQPSPAAPSQLAARHAA